MVPKWVPQNSPLVIILLLKYASSMYQDAHLLSTKYSHISTSLSIGLTLKSLCIQYKEIKKKNYILKYKLQKDCQIIFHNFLIPNIHMHYIFFLKKESNIQYIYICFSFHLLFLSQIKNRHNIIQKRQNMIYPYYLANDIGKKNQILKKIYQNNFKVIRKFSVF